MSDQVLAETPPEVWTARTYAGRGYPRARAFARHRLALMGAFVILALAFIAIFAPIIAPYDPNEIDLFATAQAPSRAHLLGTDDIGRDVLSRIIYGTRVSLSVGLVSVTIYVLIGTVLGSISGYFGGWVDSTIQ